MTRKYTHNKIDEESLQELKTAADELHELAKELGLKPPKVNYWLVDYDEINQLAAYDGFPIRYPHWRWGMKYSKRNKEDTYFGGKIFELVNHDTPANAFNQISNSIDDHKGVIAHVEAHADFFANNYFFEDNPDATGMMERHANLIQSYYDDTDIDKNEVEEWIDSVLCIQDMIDPLNGFKDIKNNNNTEEQSINEVLDSLDVSDEVKRQLTSDIPDEESETQNVIYEKDLLKFLLENGHRYNSDTERAEEYEHWQKSIIEIIRRESYYFSAQKMTKVMNEGWASIWESIMMANEAYAQTDEIINYADKQSAVLNSPGFNPYKIGKELWEYIENKENRREVVSKLLRVEGITWRNFHDKIDFTQLNKLIYDNHDEDIPYERNYSLLRNQNKGFIKNISKDELQKESRYIFDKNVYNTVEDSIKDIDYEKAWKKMREIRETHNDITFIDSFLTEEFVQDEQYFAYEYNHKARQMQVSSTSLDAVKKKILLQITNGGKPTIIAADNNYNNAGELLLKHQYNGVQLNISKAIDVLKRLFKLWGKPVHLKTIRKDKNTGEEEGLLISYDGTRTKRKEIKIIEDIQADQIDYDTKPDDWL